MIKTEATPCTDIAGFLKSERENAILSLLEETKKETQETMEKLHWDSVYRYIEYTGTQSTVYRVHWDSVYRYIEYTGYRYIEYTGTQSIGI